VTSTNFTNNTIQKRKIYGILGALFTLIIPFFFMLNDADNHLETAQSLCPLKMLTGFPCPGCGITKSLVYFYEGDLRRSLTFHLFGPFVILFSLATIVVLTTELITKKEYFNAYLYNRKMAYFLAAILVVYHIIRLVYFIKTNDFDSLLKQSIWR
jgi:hypothetical protein